MGHDFNLFKSIRQLLTSFVFPRNINDIFKVLISRCEVFSFENFQNNFRGIVPGKIVWLISGDEFR